MPYDASSELVKSSLDALTSIIGEVAVRRIGPDVNGCHIWEVMFIFIVDLGPLPADDST